MYTYDIRWERERYIYIYTFIHINTHSYIQKYIYSCISAVYIHMTFDGRERETSHIYVYI